MNVFDKILARITPEEMTQTLRKMGIAASIADAIEAKGWSQTEFAKRIGRKTADIPHLLSGDYNFTIEELTQIEFALEAKLFFSKDLGWATEVGKKKRYTTVEQPLLAAAEPDNDY
jgi:ribosome-binding protein aMBF1 (putative translation factor)